MHSFASPDPAALLVVKFGGNAMTAEAGKALLAEVASYRQAGGKVVLVHGGGPEIDAELAAKAIPTQRIEGLRVTDAATLAVTESVLCATINKRLVRDCLALPLPAIGLSGEDAGILTCEKEAGDLGFVGAVTHVNAKPIEALLDAGFLPVIAPLGVAADGSTAYNVNGDTAAGAIAAALRAQTFILVTNVERVRRNPSDASTGIAEMTLDEARSFYTSEACQQSMKPKMAAAITAAESGATAYICGPKTNTIASALAGNGTKITAQ